MNFWDWAVVVLYILLIIGIGYKLSRSQESVEDYFLGGRNVRWWHSGLSTMATQLGAISFISAPAFVAIKENGGLKWLSYELGVPLALILVMALLMPTYHRASVVSIYEYLEQRFDHGTRTLIGFLFQIGRGLAAAVSVLIGGLILSTALGVPTASAILVVGIVTLIYDFLGGIRVVIYSDVIQMGIIMAGILVCGFVALSILDWETAWSTLEPQRLQVLDFAHWGLSKEGEYGFWVMLLGGFFLYASYYGCDQSQVQRELTVGRLDNVRKSLLVNAFGRFPIVLLYCVVGVLVGAVASQPDFFQRAAEAMGTQPEKVEAALQRDPDRMVPMFILSYLPHGLIGFLFVAVLSALMSSLDSALNSLSAVSVRDFYQRHFVKDASKRHYLWASKIFTLLWGIFCVGFALVFASVPSATRETTIVLINAVGSILYGPILAVFLLGILTRRVRPGAVKVGVLFGVALNVVLWLWTPISWLWWNVTGFIMAVLVAFVLDREREWESRVHFEPAEPSRINWRRVYVVVGIYFLIIIGCSRWIEASA